MAGSPEPERKGAGGQLIIPAAGILFTLYYASTIWDSPFEAQVAAIFVGTILVVLSLVFIIRHLARWKAGAISLALDDLVGRPYMVPKRLVLFALTIGYMWFIGDLGFTITTFLFLLLSFLVLSNVQRPWLSMTVAGTASIIGYLLFIVAFETRFPRGPFETFVEGLLG
jgi:hypothetical protein